MVRVAVFLQEMLAAEASDLHIKAGEPPVIRVDGLLRRTDHERLAPEEVEAMAYEVIPDSKVSEFRDRHEVDLGLTVEGVGRFRVNVYRQRGRVSMAFRQVHSVIPSFEDLHLPPAAKTLAQERRGLVLVTGPSGTGKTTTIAAMIGWINANRPVHIVTVEDPIEAVHEDRMAVVDQREVGLDTHSYASALRHAVRQDPDVIFIGEVRDRETAETAIQAAETGHLVISTLHTLDASETINRLIDLFPPETQRQARTSLAAALGGVLSQRLLPRADGVGRVPAVEVLVNTGRVAERILDAEQTSQIRDLIQDGEFYGMQTFDQALTDLVRDGLVSVEAAMEAASDPHDLTLSLQAAELV